MSFIMFIFVDMLSIVIVAINGKTVTYYKAK